MGTYVSRSSGGSGFTGGTKGVGGGVTEFDDRHVPLGDADLKKYMATHPASTWADKEQSPKTVVINGVEFKREYWNKENGYIDAMYTSTTKDNRGRTATFDAVIEIHTSKTGKVTYRWDKRGDIGSFINYHYDRSI